MKKLIVNDTSIQLMETNGFEYICLTDMVKAKDGAFFVTDWLRNRNSLEYNLQIQVLIMANSP